MESSPASTLLKSLTARTGSPLSGLHTLIAIMAVVITTVLIKAGNSMPATILLWLFIGLIVTTAGLVVVYFVREPERLRSDAFHAALAQNRIEELKLKRPLGRRSTKGRSEAEEQ